MIGDYQLSGLDLKGLGATAKVASTETLKVGRTVVAEMVDELLHLRKVAEAAHELLDAESDAESWTDYHTALKDALDAGRGPT